MTLKGGREGGKRGLCRKRGGGDGVKRDEERCVRMDMESDVAHVEPHNGCRV